MNGSWMRLPLALRALLVMLLVTQQILAQTVPRPPAEPPQLSKTTPNVPGARLGPGRTNPTARDEEHEELVPPAPAEARVQPFGSNLFMGNFRATRDDGLNPDYVIMPGDHVALNVWGAVAVNEVLIVDGQGNIFIPQVGPIKLSGVKNAELTDVVRRGLSQVYTRYFDVYTNLITANPVSVFVTGGVLRPGRYAGIPSDSSLSFLDRAGGIDPQLGSYRDIQILREGKPIAQIDLYDFMLEGKISEVQFKDGDTILVRRRGPTVELRGSVATPSLLEFKNQEMSGTAALSVVPEAARATEVTVTGVRDGVPFSQTFSVADFKAYRLRDGDKIILRDDGRAGTILVSLDGEYNGPSVLAVKRGARLVDVLHHISVDPELANIDGVHIRRASVARAQKDSIDDALFRLERSALLALSSTDNETNIRVKEADLVQRFVERARTIQPLGRVVTMRDGRQLNIRLEEGDTIVIPPRTNIVRVSGEIFMSQAVMYKPGWTAKDYIEQAGGYSERAEKGKVVIHHANARVEIRNPNAVIQPGDEILVPPKVDVKVLQGIADITQIIYQVAISSAFIILLTR
jgi:protein involved in polysaccharide export with SLBB domain